MKFKVGDLVRWTGHRGCSQGLGLVMRLRTRFDEHGEAVLVQWAVKPGQLPMIHWRYADHDAPDGVFSADKSHDSATWYQHVAWFKLAKLEALDETR